MNITQKQELLVARYLREVGAHLSDLPSDAVEQVLRRIRARLAQEFDQSGEAMLRDDEVLQVLRRLGAPAEVARSILDNRPPDRVLALSAQDRRWLGVCAGLAEWAGYRVTLFRLLALVLGLLTGPFALTAYLITYFVLYVRSTDDGIPPIGPVKLAKSVLGTLAMLLAFHAGTRGVFFGVRYAYERFMDAGELTLGQWGWLEPEMGRMLFWLILVLMPLSVLAGLPVANGWDYTVKRLTQAILALYVVALCLGMGSMMAGIIFLIVEHFSVQ